MLTIPNSASRNTTSVLENEYQRIFYDITFPPGAMGLELEPVIKSSEREIGCRVKDYYFSLHHKGIDPSYVQSSVSIGDVICSIDGEDVKSWPFVSIVEHLRLKKDMQRKVSFKNITASWRNGTKANLNSTVIPSRSATKSLSVILQHSENSVNGENSIALSTAHSSSMSPLRKRKGLSVVTFTPSKEESLNMSSNIVQSISSPRALSPLTPSALRSLQRKSTPKVNRSPEVDPTDESFSRLATAMNSLGVDHGIGFGPVTNTNIGLDRVMEVAFNAIAAQPQIFAENIIKKTKDNIPIYSSREMDEVIRKKNELLGELSHSVMLLRNAEEKQRAFHTEVETFENLRETYNDLLLATEFKNGQIDDLLLKVKTLETEIHILKNEGSEDQKTMQSLESENHSLRQTIQSLSAQVESFRAQNSFDNKMWQNQFEKFQEEKSQEITELNQALFSTRAQLEEAYFERDRVGNDLELTKDLFLSEQKAKNAELERHISAYEEHCKSYKTSLIEREEEISNLYHQLSEANQLFENANEEKVKVTKELIDFQTLLASTETKLLKVSLQSEDAVSLLSQKEEIIKEMTIDEQRHIDNTKLQSEIISDLKSENELLSGKVHILELTIGAQNVELDSLQKDIDSLNAAMESNIKQSAKQKMSIESALAKHLAFVHDLRDISKALRHDINEEKLEFKENWEKVTSILGNCSVTSSAKMESYADAIAFLRLELNKIRERNAELEGKISDYYSERNSSSDRVLTIIAEKDFVIEREKQMVVDKSAELLKLSSAYEAMMVQYKESIDKITEMDSKLVSYQQELDNKEEFISSLKLAHEEMLSQHENELEKATTTLLCISKQFDEQKDAFSLQENLSLELKQALDVKDQEFIASMTQAEEINAQKLKSMEDQVQRLREDYIFIKSKSEEDTMQFQNQAEWLNETNQELKSRIEDIVALLESTRADLEIERQSKRELLAEVDEQALRLQSQENMMTESSANEIILTKKISDLQQQLSEQQMALDQTLAVNTELKSTFSVIEKKFQLSEEALKSDNDDLKSQLQFYKDKLKCSQLALQGVNKIVLSEVTEWKSYMANIKSEILSLVSLHNSDMSALNSHVIFSEREAISSNQAFEKEINSLRYIVSEIAKEKEDLVRSSMASESAMKKDFESQVMSSSKILNDKIDSLSNELSEKEQELTSSRDVVVALREQNASLSTDLKAATETITSLEMTKAGLSEQLATFTSVMERLNQADSEQLKRVQVAFETIRQLRDENESLLSRLALSQKSIDELLSDNNLLVMKLAESERLLDEAEQAKSSISQRASESVSEIQSDFDSVSAELSLAKSSLESEKNKVKDISALLDREKQLVSRLTTEIQSLNDYASTLELDRQKALTDLAALSKQSQQRLQSQMAEVDEKSRAVESLKEELENKISSQELLIQSLFKEKEALAISSSSAALQSQAISSELSNSHQTIATLEETIRVLNERCLKLEAGLDEASKVIAEQKRQISHLEKGRADLQVQVMQKCQVEESWKAEAERNKQSSQHVVKSLEDKLYSVEQDALLLSEYLEKSKVELELRTAEKVALAKSIGAVTDQLSSAQEQLSTVKAIEASLKNDNATLKDRLESVTLNCKVLEQEIDRLRDRAKHSLEKNNDEAKAQLTAQLNTLQRQLEVKSTEANKATSEAKVLQARLSELREIMNALQNALKLAEARESEQSLIKSQWEQQLKTRESQCSDLQQQLIDLDKKMHEICLSYEKRITGYNDEIDQARKSADVANDALQAKQLEFDQLVSHVNELVASIKTPKKAERPSVASPPTSKPRRQSNHSHDKENCVLADITALTCKENTSDSNVLLDFTPNEEWLEEMIMMSLQMHELISFLFIQFNGDLQDSKVNIFFNLSVVHHKYHERLVRAPWIKAKGPVPSLMPAHEVAEKLLPSELLSKVKIVKPKSPAKVYCSQAGTTVPASACKAVIKLLLAVLRRKRKVIATNPHPLGGGEDHSIIEEKYDEEVSSSSDDIAVRIDRWIRAVDQYERVDSIDSRPMIRSPHKASVAESSDAVRTSADFHIYSALNTKSFASPSPPRRPAGRSHSLVNESPDRDENASGQLENSLFFNISTDDSSILDFEYAD